MNNVVQFKQPKPVRPSPMDYMWFRMAVTLLGMVCGLSAVGFGTGLVLPYLIHECAPIKPFMEKF